MGTESFNHIKPALAHGENVKLQHEVAGDLVTAKVRASNAFTNGDIQPAGLFSTAPYKPDEPKRAAGREKKCKAHNDTCNGWATSTGYCLPHSKKLAE